MKLTVVIDSKGDLVSLSQPTPKVMGAPRLSVRAPEGGRVLALEVPVDLAGKSLNEIHDVVSVDLSGHAPTLRRKSN
jgi:hypothetical protein